jgi:hypothetical protein
MAGCKRLYDEAEDLLRRLVSIDPAHHQAMYCFGIEGPHASIPRWCELA